MPSTFTSSLRLTLPATGENAGTWGNLVNTGITTLIDTSIAGTASITIAGVDYTLTNNNGTTDEARAMFINATGTPGAGRNVICPAASKMYIFRNNTTGGFAMTLKTSAGSGIAVPAGQSRLLYCDGTNVVEAVNAFSSLTLGTALGVASGGTGAASLTANNVLLGNGTSAFQVVAPGTNGNILTSNGTTWQSTAPAASGVTTISFGSTGLTPNTATSGAVSVAGTLAIANGGTGATTLAGANIPVTNAANTFTGTQTFSGSSSVLGMVLNDAAEVATISATAATGTINYDITTQSVLYYTTNATANWTVNFRASSGTSLNTAMSTGQSVTVAFLVTQGSTAYYNNVVQVDGTTSGVTTRWIGGAPTAGNASGIDSYRYVIIKTAAATFTVLASNTQFKA
jgi:hypothetical protein